MSRSLLNKVLLAASLVMLIVLAGTGVLGQPFIAVFWDEGIENQCFRICCGNTYPLLKTLYVFVLPSDEGIMSAEFYLDLPDDEAIQPLGLPEYCDDVSGAFGGLFDPDDPLALGLQDCHTGGWKFIVSHMILFLDEYTDYDWIRVKPPLWAGSPQVATCETGYPPVAADAIDAGINYTCLMGPSCPDIEIIPPPPAAVVLGDSIVLDFSVTNISDAWHSEVLTVNVSQTQAWTIGYPETLGVVRCNCSTTVPVSVKIPESLPYATDNRITVKVISWECGYAVWEGSTLLQYPIAVDETSWGAIKKLYE